MRVVFLTSALPHKNLNSFALPIDNSFKPVQDMREPENQSAYCVLATASDKLMKFIKESGWELSP